jgi:NodT family efflux transporter outer membrane factor (OMF) lipoprotein
MKMLYDAKMLACAAILVLQAACSTPAPRPAGLPVDVPGQFSRQGEMPTREDWWTALDDPRLDDLVEEALSGNFSLQTAWHRVVQARELAVQAGADLFPELDATAGAERTVSEMDRPGSDRDYSTRLSLGLRAGYEVDLWGRIRSRADAAALDAAATTHELQAAAITLSARVALTYYGIVEQMGQIDVLQAQLATNEDYLEIVTLQARRGQAPAADVLQQRQLVEATRGDLALARSRLQVLRHQLAVLLGRAPGELDAEFAEDVPAPPPLPDTGVPAHWLRARPDVRAAALRAGAADLRVLAAVANRFPRLTLSATATTTTEELSDLFDNWVATLAANLVAPLMDGGRRRSEVRRTEAALQERLHAYAQEVLDALREVEDALVQEHRQAQYVRSLERQLDLLRDAVDQTKEYYRKGNADFTRYLTTLLSYQRLQRTHLRARRQRMEFRIELYRALGTSVPLGPPQRMEPPLRRRPAAATTNDHERETTHD